MFVQNQIRGLPNHQSVIAAEAKQASEVVLAVAYVKENGVDMVLDGLKNKPVRLLCSFDMGITQISGIKKMLANGAEVRVYKSAEGTFHPKMWLFKIDGKWRSLIGSANLTRAALSNNVEASALLDDENIVASTISFFNYLWGAENSHEVTSEDADRLQEAAVRRQRMRIAAAAESPAQIEQAGDENKLFSFVKSWIDISKGAKKGISSLWRGWYIIPDHGYVDDELAFNLASYLPLIGDGISLVSGRNNPEYRRLLEKFRQNSKFQRAKLILSLHSLFVRQAKNYLIKFGWAYHPLVLKKGHWKREKRFLMPTALGKQIARCQNVRQIRALYSEHFEDWKFLGVHPVKFTRRLLKQFGKLDAREFGYFVSHAYDDDDADAIAGLIAKYRGLADKKSLHKKITQYFDAVKEPTASNVRGNYDKNVKHTMSAIGWCEGFSFDSKNLTITLDGDGN